MLEDNRCILENKKQRAVFVVEAVGPSEEVICRPRALYSHKELFRNRPGRPLLVGAVVARSVFGHRMGAALSALWKVNSLLPNISMSGDRVTALSRVVGGSRGRTWPYAILECLR